MKPATLRPSRLLPLRFAVLVSCICTLALGCPSSSSGSNGGPASVGGVVVRGDVDGATVEVYEPTRTGSLKRLLGTTTTDDRGRFKVKVGRYNGPVVICAYGGSTTDLASGAPATIDAATPMYGMGEIRDGLVFRVTPLTTQAYERWKSTSDDPNNTVADNMQNAFNTIGALYGLANFQLFTPANLTVGPVQSGFQADLGAVIAGMSEYSVQLGVSYDGLSAALGQDIEDGTFDGKRGTADIPLGGGFLSPTAGTAGVGGAIRAFVETNPFYQGGIPSTDYDVDDTLLASNGVLARRPLVLGFENSYAHPDIRVTARLYGRYFGANPSVEVGGVPANVLSASSDEIVFEVPELGLGKYDTVVGAETFTRLIDGVESFDPDARPRIFRVEPNTASTAGGTIAQMWGENFGPSTFVMVNGRPAPMLAHDFPGWMAFRVPAGTNGPGDVEVYNGARSASLPNAFEYRDRDLRAGAPVPDPQAPHLFGGFRLFYHLTEGLKVEAFQGTSTLVDPDLGDFTITDFSASQANPFVTTRNRFGTTFNTDESIARAMFFSDPANGIGDFVRGWTNERSGASFGATFAGVSAFFPEADSLTPSVLSKDWWINGMRYNAGTDTLTQTFGWGELTPDGCGSFNVQSHSRRTDGSDWQVGVEYWTMQYDVTSQGRFTGTRMEDGADLTGAFDEDALAAWIMSIDPDQSIGFYQMTPIDYGLENAFYGGYVGGGLFHDLEADGAGGFESVLEAGSLRGVAGLLDARTSWTRFDRTTELRASDPEGCFGEKMSIGETTLTPSGILYASGFRIGAMSRSGLTLVPLGEFPHVLDRNGGPDLRAGMGAMTFRHSRKSHLSLQGEYTHASYALNLNQPGGGAFTQQSTETRLEDITFDALTPAAFDGLSLTLSGSFDDWETDTQDGFSRWTSRGPNGEFQVTDDFAVPMGVAVGYTVVDDTLDLFATRSTVNGTRLENAQFPYWMFSGELANDQQVAALRGNVKEIGDSLGVLVKDPEQDEPLMSDMALSGLSWYVDNPIGTASAGLRGLINFMGNGDLSADLTTQMYGEDGSFSSASQIADGSWSLGPDGLTRVEILAGPQRTYEGKANGGFFAGVDRTPGSTVNGMVIMTDFASMGAPLESDFRFVGMFADPALSQTTTSQTQFTPDRGRINYTGELFGSLRSSIPVDFKSLPAQEFAVTNPIALGPGEFRTSFAGSPRVLEGACADSGIGTARTDMQADIPPELYTIFMD